MTMLSANIANVFSDSLMTALIIVVVVFSALLALSLVIGAFGKIGTREKAPMQVKPVPTKPAVVPSAPAPSAVVGDDEDEIAAVIAAAVAMMAPAGVTYKVRRITPTGGRNRSEWAAAAVRQNTMPF